MKCSWCWDQQGRCSTSTWISLSSLMVMESNQNKCAWWLTWWELLCRKSVILKDKMLRRFFFCSRQETGSVNISPWKLDVFLPRRGIRNLTQWSAVCRFFHTELTAAEQRIFLKTAVVTQNQVSLCWRICTGFTGSFECLSSSAVLASPGQNPSNARPL